MSQLSKILFGLALLALIVAAIAGVQFVRFSSPAFKMVMQGSSSTSDKLQVSGGNLVVIAPRPGVFFGTVKKPGGEEQFTYVIFFRYGAPLENGAGHGIDFHCTSDGRSAETKDAISLEGKRIEAAYRVELDEAHAAVASERLTIGGNDVDIAAGQVFLIDVTAETPQYRQKKATIPAIVAKRDSTQAVEQTAQTLRKELAAQDPEIKEFLK